MNWCGYIDLLGSRDAARRSSHELLVSLDSFHSALSDASPYFEGDCYAFSDGAFFRCENLEDFYVFYTRVRNQLFQAGRFFRCSLLPGEIGVNRRESRPRGDHEFVSYTFTKSAPEAYQRELNFKGVGCTIDVGKSAGKQKPFIIETFFLDVENKKYGVTKSLDFRYSDLELCGPDDTAESTFDGEIRLVESLISSCHRSLARSSKVASYYISAFVAAIRSSDLSSVDWKEDRKSWIDAPYLFRELMSDGPTKLLKEVPGFHLVMLACFNHLFMCKGEDIDASVELRVVRQMSQFPLCFRNLDRIPDCVIGPAARQQLVELKLAEARDSSRRRPRIAR